MKKESIEEVVILYNPNSTGNSLKNAHLLRRDLKAAQFKKPISLIGTKYPKHAEKIAKEYAKGSKRILLVSSSGDGGYHELINGVLAHKSSKVITGLLASGNANDHHHAMAEGSIVEQIMKNTPRPVDVIQVTSKIGGKKWIQFAHSYVGIGISPAIGGELNKQELNVFNEKIILFKELFTFNYVRIVHNGQRIKVNSLVCANIPRMSKALKIAQESNPDDGRFEVTIVRPGSRWAIFVALFKAATLGLEERQSCLKYSFESIKRLPIQLDGEIYMIDAGASVSIRAIKHGLSVIM